MSRFILNMVDFSPQNAFRNMGIQLYKTSIHVGLLFTMSGLDMIIIVIFLFAVLCYFLLAEFFLQYSPPPMTAMHLKPCQ